MPRGGYRKPGNPAPVSGPGKLSRRTDGGPMQGPKVAPGGKYGERKAMQEMQSAAPMAASQRQPNKVPLPNITPLTAPTSRPDEPVTAGVPMGPGPGPEALGPIQTAKLSDVLAKIVDYDPSGEVADLYDYLLTRGL
jgi:hypothetical protein